MIQRPRRLRRGQALRDLVAQTVVTPANLILPLFIIPGKGKSVHVKSMPGVSQLTADLALKELKRAEKLGVRAFILFGVTPKERKDERGSHANAADNEVCSAVKRIKDAGLNIVAISDLCFCEYTSHGHCGAMCADDKLVVENDETIEMLGEQALNHARSGFDVIAPSGMMDGAVGAIRAALDASSFEHIAIMAYAVKYASAFYGPFRDAAESAPGKGDRQGYQMDFRNAREALREAALDEEQGADMLMVKPGMPYLDILSKLREQTKLPLAAYQVSGEYAMLKAAAQNGWLDGQRVLRESVYAIKRAGADMILTYAACELSERAKNGVV
ncbi:MAG: porphobilinogen synthase [Planctomycetes bacterium]|nr:porphobilinogen synthase [Planctomycetota bacterium]